MYNFVPIFVSDSNIHIFLYLYQHHNYADGRLAVLIELNEYVTLVLNKLDLIAADLHEDSPHSPRLLPVAPEDAVLHGSNNQRTALGGRVNAHLNLAPSTSSVGVGSAMARKVGESAFSAVPPQVWNSSFLFYEMLLCVFEAKKHIIRLSYPPSVLIFSFLY